jgi:choice-of-anchor B domain-containing protein
MSLIGELDYQALHNSDISDVWGYTDEFGNDYALVGVNDGGVSIVDLSDPNNPAEIFFYAGPSSIWRDLKVWNDHVYITTEGGGGLAIIDLTPLPGNTNLTAISWQGAGWQSAHNLYIDENGVCYIFGANRDNGGVIFLDLTIDPMNPVEIGSFEQWYFHDGMARGDTLYGGNISDGLFSIVDVSDKQNPQILGTFNTNRNNSVHNIWVSDDGNYVFTTDEISGGYLGSYDISDPTDIKEVDLTLSDPGSGTIPHNTHVIGDFIFTSYYRLGCTVHDISRPSNVIETAFYDTSPALSGGGFNGSWGAYPYFPSGIALGTDIENGLFVFDVDYVHACWLEGTITDAVSNMPVPGASISLQTVGVQDSSMQNGTYGTGYHTAGNYDVLVSKPGYMPQTISSVQLMNDSLTILDVALQPLVSFTLSGVVQEAVSNMGIPNAIVTLTNPDFNYSTVSNNQGGFNLPGVFDGTYDVTVGAWGWQTYCQSGVLIDQNSTPISFSLIPGYMDDFALDLGWTTDFVGATSGFWERDEPILTTYQGGESNPGSDITGDCLGNAYITGNGGFGAGVDDIDDGTVWLTSPAMDLTTYIAPRISYYRWFFNGGGTGTPNDEMNVWISNGTDTVLFETIDVNSPGNQTWLQNVWNVGDFIAITSNMNLIVEASDLGAGHLVEGGLDGFEVIEGPTSMVEEIGTDVLGIFPNPSEDLFTVSWGTLDVQRLQILDSQGRLVASVGVSGNSFTGSDLEPGCYLVSAETRGKRYVKRLIIE